MNVIQFTIGQKTSGRRLAETAAASESSDFFLAGGAYRFRSPDNYLTASPGPLSSGGCGRASPVVPGGTSLLVNLVSTRWIVVANAAIIATARTVAKIARVICVRRRLLQLRSLFMGKTLSNLNQRNPLEPVPPSARLGSAVSPSIGDRRRIMAWVMTM